MHLVEETVSPFGLELFDFELRPGVARVVVDRQGGIDLETIEDVSRAVSRLLDAHDPFPGGRYTLEVSSPGLERPLRTPAHFKRAVGEIVTVRTYAGTEGERRVRGKLLEAGDEGMTIAVEQAAEAVSGASHRHRGGGRTHATAGDVARGPEEAGRSERHIAYEDIERARTVFEWGTGNAG